MKLFLDPRLADHRRGRFLMTQLGAVPMVDVLPEEGVLLMIGADFQGIVEPEQAALWQWSRQSGRTLLLLPPYNEGALFSQVDWRIHFQDQPPVPNGTLVADKLTNEAMLQIQGRDGDSDRTAGHRWNDFSVNTRFIKHYAASGVFAATTLPLWSIALLDAAEPTLRWIANLYHLAGKPAGPITPSDAEVETIDLTPQAMALMVMVYGWATSRAEDLKRAMSLQAVPIVSMDIETMAALLQQLSAAGYLVDQGLSEKGFQVLASSAYWGYAKSLREEVA